MRTLLCEGIGAFIVFEDGSLPWNPSLFLIGVFLRNPNRGGQVIPLERRSSLMAHLLESISYLGSISVKILFIS